MSKAFRHSGKAIDWTNDTGSDVASGDVVVVGHVLAVAETDIADTEAGSVSIRGVYEAACKSSDVINIGDKLSWDVSASKFTNDIGTAATGDCSNCAIATSFSGVGNLLVEASLTPGTGTTT